VVLIPEYVDVVGALDLVVANISCCWAGACATAVAEKAAVNRTAESVMNLLLAMGDTSPRI
jgi:hypothetical protein